MTQKPKKAQPFAEPNFTQFSNDALDYVMRTVSPNAWKIISVAIRKTYGWHKDKDTISLSQFQELTGIKNRSTVTKVIREVLDEGILIRTPSGMSFEYFLNREYVFDRSDQSNKRTGTSPKNGLPTSPENGHTKERVKDIIKDRPTTDGPNIYELYESHIGPLVPMIADTLRDAEDDYPEAWVLDAIRIAVKRNARNWNFIKKILERWDREGKDDGLENKPSTSAKAQAQENLIDALEDQIKQEEVIDV